MSGRDETADRAERARSWAAEHAAQLVGTRQATAERMVTEAGLRVKVDQAQGWTTQEFGIGRIRLVVDGDTVIAAHAG